MTLNKFYLNFIVRLILICLFSLLAAFYYVNKGIDISLAFIIFLLIIQAIALARFVNKTISNISYFFSAVKNDDSSLIFSEDNKSSSFNDLYSSLNMLNNKLSEARMMASVHEHFNQAVIESTATAIIAVAEKGAIELANSAAKSLFGINNLHNINQLQRVNKNLPGIIDSLEPGDSETGNILVGETLMHLKFSCVHLNIEKRKINIIGISDISQDLDRQEIDSWQKLIRILNHEIMNSVAPITSLSSTISGFFRKEGKEIKPSDVTSKTISDSIKGLEVIESHGKGLIRFVDSYRSLTKLPRPNPENIQVIEVLDRIVLLAGSLQDMRPKNEPPVNITREVADDLSIYADEELLSRVLLNIVKNAFEALIAIPDPSILLSAVKDRNGRVIIKVSDNGPGIPEEIYESIFIPFFTTKEGGNGIGLSLSKQIMNIHKGKISVVSSPGHGTTFILQI